MDRRNFLGSLLGTVAATAMLGPSKFLVATEADPWQRLELPFKGFYKTTEFGVIQGPAIIRCRFEGGVFSVLLETITIEQPITITGLILKTDALDTLRDYDYKAPFVLSQKGDTFTAGIHFTLDQARGRGIDLSPYLPQVPSNTIADKLLGRFLNGKS